MLVLYDTEGGTPYNLIFPASIIAAHEKLSELGITSTGDEAREELYPDVNAEAQAIFDRIELALMRHDIMPDIHRDLLGNMLRYVKVRILSIYTRKEIRKMGKEAFTARMAELFADSLCRLGVEVTGQQLIDCKLIDPDQII